MVEFLVVLSVLSVVGGGFMASPATSGVASICTGVAFGVWARLAQASLHRKEDLQARSKGPA